MNTKIRKLCAFAALAAMCAGAAQAVDWETYSGTTYIVPAGVTNEVTSADFAAVNKIATIVFEDEYSALLVTTSAIPDRVIFQGPGSVVFPQKVLLVGSSAMRRIVGAANVDQFVKFVFQGGIEGADGSSKNLFYWCNDNRTSYGPSNLSLTNATLYLDGMVTNVAFRGMDSNAYNGRFDFGENIDLTINTSIANTDGSFGVIRQRGGIVTVTSAYLSQKNSSYAAYLLEGGSLTVKNPDNRWYVYGPYLYFRQTGGDFYCRCWQRPDSENNADTLPFDFIYGGDATASCGFEYSTPKFIGPMNVAVMDNAQVDAGWLYAAVETAAKYTRNVAVNGGVLIMNTRDTAKRTHFSFNGGTLRTTGSGTSMFGNNERYGNASWVRIYENGGCIFNDNESNSDSQYLNLPHLKAPEGNVVRTIPIPAGHELESRVWQTPPSVEIYDETNGGSNAVAVVDYDFDTGRVTNITVVCRGEGYAEGRTKANLRYKASGAALLAVPLVCEVGPCAGGDVTLAGGKTIYAGGVTNTYCGATIVDMDRESEYDHPSASGQVMTRHSLILKPDGSPRFYSTNVVVKSGSFYYDGDPTRDQLTKYFPDCARLELYGGHLSKWICSFRDLVIGGECWLCNNNLGYEALITVPADGTLWVDVSCMTNDVTPKLKYGSFVFEDGATVAIKNFDTLPRGHRRVVLDLSETTTFLTASANINLVQPEDGVLYWDAAEKKLYARRHADGMLLIFR